MNCHVRSHNYALFTPPNYVNLWCVYMITNECYLTGKHRCQELGLSVLQMSDMASVLTPPLTLTFR